MAGSTNGSNPYQVRGVTVRQAAQLGEDGRPYMATVVTFYVGQNGPFTTTFAPGQATAQAVVAAITATVNQLRDQDAQITALNSQV
jgi:hypothetical protein